MNWRDWLQSEHWKRSAALGWLGFLVVLGRYALTGDDPGAGMVTLILGTLGISGAWQLGKRATHWTPEQVRNGLGQ